MLQYLIVCPLIFLAGLVDSIAGGGGLISLPAYLIAGVPAHMAIGTNKLSSVFGTTVSTVRFMKNGYMKLKLGVMSAVLGLIGSFIGAHLSLLVSERFIKYLMLIVLPVVAFYVLRHKNIGDNEETGTLPEAKMYAICAAAAFFVGGYDGFYGPGTGTFLILIFTGAAKLDIKTANGNAKVVNLASNVAAVTTFIANGTVIYSLGLAAAVFGILGNYIGSGMVMKNGQKIVRPVILVVLAILFIKILSGQ